MNTSLTLESLGLTKEEITERVVDRIVDQMLYCEQHDGEGESYKAERRDFTKAINDHVKARIDAGVEEIAAKHVLPNMQEYIQNVTLQATNEWGTAKGEPLTFIEYLVERAEAYMTEGVDYDGKTQGAGYGSWKKAQTRIAHMVDKYLHYSIETAMKNALQVANNAIAEGIQETVKIKLGEIQEQLKVKVGTR